MRTTSYLALCLLRTAAASAAALVLIGLAGGLLAGCVGQRYEANIQGDPESLIYTKDGLALNGYDPVSYFQKREATPGSAEHTIQWKGATWRFESADHAASFEADPRKYVPQYGGYCAWGVAAKDDLFPSDPTQWRIVDGKLYLNFDADVQETWLEDVPGHVRRGDANWPELSRARTPN